MYKTREEKIDVLYAEFGDNYDSMFDKMAKAIRSGMEGWLLISDEERESQAALLAVDCLYELHRSGALKVRE